MRELHLKMSMSLDGFVAGPKHEAEWIFRTNDDTADEWTMDKIANASLHAMGRKTFHDMVSWWPFVEDRFAAPMNDIPKAVFTQHGAASVDTKPSKEAFDNAAKSLQQAPKRREPDPKVLKLWQDAYVAAGPMKDEVAKLKQADGGPIVAHGGAGFARSLIATGLVDEYQLLVHPVVLGKGLPIFTEIGYSHGEKPRYLKRVESIQFPKGEIGQVYRPE